MNASIHLRLVTDRPRTRGECVDAPRPCPYSGCRYHLSLDVAKRAVGVRAPPRVRVYHPDEDGDPILEGRDSCALDVADRGGASFDEIAKMLNVTRQRVQQIEIQALSLDFVRKHAMEMGEDPLGDAEFDYPKRATGY